mgnify:CR=1 FL=1
MSAARSVRLDKLLANLGYGSRPEIHALARARATRLHGADLPEAGAPLDHLVFHVPAGGRYLCLEPVSHVADAFNLAASGKAGTGARVLRAGEAISATMRIELA